MTMRNMMEAIAEVQLLELRKHCGGAGPIDNIQEVAGDIEGYLTKIPPGLRTLLETQLALIEIGSGLGEFKNRPVEWRREKLRNLFGGGAFTYYFSLSWMVIFSRDWARNLVNFKINPSTPAAPVTVDPPPPADLTKTYDICIIGSGAGGAMAAFRLGTRWKGSKGKILVIEAGPWVSPDQMTTRHDAALGQLYKNGGAQPAPPTIPTLVSGNQTGINVLQARVAGGGPTVNNAIQFPLTADAYNRWLEYGFPDLRREMEEAFLDISRDLGVRYTNPWTGILMNAGDPRSALAAGWRAEVLRGANSNIIKMMESMPVSVHDCVGCGGCNTGCRYGRKTGGVHDYRKNGALNGYFMRSIHETDGAVEFYFNIEAENLIINNGRATALRATKRSGGKAENIQIRAKSFIISGGPVASSLLLQKSLPPRSGKWFSPGDAITANVVTPMYAIFPKAAAAPSDPGLQMCFFTDPEKGVLLETWFDYPGSLAIGLNGDAANVSTILKDYEKLSTLGVVVPIEKFGEVREGYLTKIRLELGEGAFTKIVRAVAHAAKLMYTRGAEKVYCGHRHSPKDLADRGAPEDWILDKKLALGPDFEAFVNYIRNIIRKPADLSLQTAHPQSGNPVATKPERGVVSPKFKVFGTSNLFIADSSLFPAGARVNPQMTAMALSRMAADRAGEYIDSGAPDAVEL